MKKKRIAMCVSGNMDGFHDEMIRGVRETAEVLGIELLVFHGLLGNFEIEEPISEAFVKGEDAVYDRIPYDDLDGIIIASSTILLEDTTKNILKEARQRKIPVIDIDGVQSGCYHVLLDDYLDMEQMMRHIVEEHGLTRINMITGFKGNRESEERLRAYKQVLTDHMIPIEEKRIGYGRFGEEAERVMEQFFDGSTEIPQAIVCANDAMAIIAINFLEKRGYRIPEDIIVTGYDGSEYAIHHNPSITTIRRGVREAGELAVRQLVKIWDGTVDKLDLYAEAAILFNQSCGCKPRTQSDEGATYTFIQEKMDENQKLRINSMNLLYLLMQNSEKEILFSEVERQLAYYGVDQFDVFLGGEHMKNNYRIHFQKEQKTECIRAESFESVYEECLAENASPYVKIVPIHREEDNYGYFLITQENPLHSQIFSRWLSYFQQFICMYLVNIAKKSK